MKIKNPEVKVGQICWLAGGFDGSLSGKLVKVTSVSKKNVVVRLLHPTDMTKIWLDGGDTLSLSSSFWLFTKPEEYRDWCEGWPDSISISEPAKVSNKCTSCGAKITSKMKFCSNCGAALTSTTK